MLTLDDYLRRYENPFDAFYVLEKMDAGICVLDPDKLNFLYLNDKVCSLLGYEKHELLGRNYLEIVPERYLDIREKYRDALEDEGHYGWMDIALTSAAGKEIAVGLKGRYVTYQGKQTILSIMQWDSAPTKASYPSTETFCKNVEAMMVNELDFDPQWLMDNLPLGVGVASPDGLIRYVNKVHANWLGYEPEEMLGKPNLSFLHPDAAKDPKVASKFLSVLTFGYYDWFEVESLHRDRTSFPVRARGTLEKFHHRKCVVGLFDRLG